MEEDIKGFLETGLRMWSGGRIFDLNLNSVHTAHTTDTHMMPGNKKTNYLNFWDKAKAMLRGIFTVVQT